MKTHSTCDHQRLENYLQSGNFQVDDPQVIEHLDWCQPCREYAQRHAGDAQAWQHIADLLRPHQFDQAGSPECSAATILDDSSQQPIAVQNVLDGLSPSEYPNRLGRLGSYEVTGVIGVGGMGVVLKALDPSLDRVVALKVMAPRLANNPKARQRFAREAKAAAAVHHPNVIPIHGVTSDGSLPYLVMRYVRGESLQKRLQQKSPLPVVEILRIGSQIAGGLAAAHGQGLVHRDIKPENILLEKGVERVTITDFGLARAVDDNSVTQQGTIAGTPMYMSPEQARGEQVDQKSDLFSLGSVLYALCTGHPPYQSDTSYGVMRRIIDESPVPIRQRNPAIPEWLAAIVDKLMAKEKADRFESAAETGQLLEACLSHVQQSPVTDPPAIKQFKTDDGSVGTATASVVPAVQTPLPKTDSLSTSDRPKPVTQFLNSTFAGRLMISILVLCAGTVGFMLMQSPPNDTPERQQKPAQELAANTDSNEIVGTWEAVSLVVNGAEVASYRPKITFGPETITTTFDNFLLRGATAHSTYRLDSSTSPKSIVMNSNAKPTFGIYKIDKNTLQICTNEYGDAKSPTEFESKAGSENRSLMTFKRVDINRQPLVETTANSDQQQILGGWKLIELVKNGRADETDGKVEWIFAGKQLSIVTKGSLFKAKVGATYQLAPSTTTKTIAINRNGESKTSIYELRGDTLRICFNDNDNGKSPTAFESIPDSDNNLLMTFERLRADQPKDVDNTRKIATIRKNASIRKDATNVAVSYFTALIGGDLEKANELVTAPYDLDGKKVLSTTEEVWAVHKRIIEKKGKRDVPAYKIVELDDAELLDDDSFPPHIVIRFKIAGDDEKIDVFVTSDGDPKVIGFTD